MKHYQSDHYPIYAKINLTKSERGPGYWKFNNSLLQDEDFCSNMERLIDNVWSEGQNISDIHVR